LKKGKRRKGETAGAGDRWLKSWCAMCLPNECGILVHLKDGVVVEVKGNPECPTNKGRLCVRGALSSIPGFYSPFRLKSPLKRTNPRKGLDEDPGWREISWEEALEEIGARLRSIRAEDPRKFVFVEGWGTCDGILGREIWQRMPDGTNEYGSIFALAAGSPNHVGSHGPLCAIHYSSNLVHGAYPEQIADLQHCRYLIAVGRTIGPNSGSTAATKRFLNAIDRGMKLVVIDPRCSVEASKASRWIPIRPGTELALALAMVHVILYELKKFDEEFVRNRTNGPYLIAEDGLYFRDPESGKPMIWDQRDGRAKVFSDQTLSEPALDGEYGVFGQPVKPAFSIIRDSMKPYTPEWAEGITTISAEVIRTITREFVDHAMIGSTIEIEGYRFPFRPAQFSTSGRGAVNHKNGTFFDLTGKMINMLVGAVEVPGGFTGGMRGANPDSLRPDKDGVVTPILEAIGHAFKFPPDRIDGLEFFPLKHSTPNLMARNILDPSKYHLNYEVELVLMAGANPVRSTADPQEYVEAFRKVPLVVSIAAQLDESTVLSDIVLPNSHFLEKRGIRIFRPALQSVDDELRGIEVLLGREPVPALYDTKSSDEILLELADRGEFLTGPGGVNDLLNQMYRFQEKHRLELGRKYDMQEITDHIVRNLFGDEHDYAELMEKGFLHRYSVKGKEAYNYYYWPENKTRHPIYFNLLKETGERLKRELQECGIRHPAFEDESEFFKFYEAVPFWVAPDESAAPEEYDLYAINWKTNFRMHGTGSILENAWLKELRDQDPYETYVMINAETAARKGLKDGDRVIVESRYGKTEGRVKSSELIHPEVVGIPGNYGGRSTSFLNPVSSEGAWFNALLSSRENRALDPITAGIENAPRVKVVRASRG